MMFIFSDMLEFNHTEPEAALKNSRQMVALGSRHQEENLSNWCVFGAP